jgi:superfamily I DNA/RNA helicase
MALRPITLQGEQKRVLFLPVTDPIQIKGVAGSGKTTVALYRAKHLLDTQSNLFQSAKVAIFTYNKILVKYIAAIRTQVSGGYQKDTDEIKPSQPVGLNVVVTNFHKWAYHFLKLNGINLYNKAISRERQIEILQHAIAKNKQAGSNITNKKPEFFIEEISWMKGKMFKSSNEYYDSQRIGRGSSDRVSKNDKEVIWKIFTEYNSVLKSDDKVDFEDFALLCNDLIDKKVGFVTPFTHIVIDEAQDLSKAEIMALTRIVSAETKSISIIADAAQRIYKSGFTWSEVGLNVRGGRTIEFKKNYRNRESIAKAAISLLDKEPDKSDFTIPEPARTGGEKPVVGYFTSWNEQAEYLLNEITWLGSQGLVNSTVVLHRSSAGLQAIKKFLVDNNIACEELRNAEEIDFDSDSIKLCTLSSIKGLEFENVFILDVNDDVIPYPPGFSDAQDEYHISTERRLLYTAMTRARERFSLLSSGFPSRYLSEIDSSLVQVIGEPSDPLPY